MINAMLFVLKQTASTVLPTPQTQHYSFDFREVISVYLGLALAPKDYYDASDSIIRLWIHEHLRVYEDRMLTEDKVKFRKILRQAVQENFTIELNKYIPSLDTFTFSTSVSNTTRRIYLEVDDIRQLTAYVHDKLTAADSTADLLLFKEAIIHICKISRALERPARSLVLWGGAGNGMQTLVDTAAALCGYEVFRIPNTSIELKSLNEMLVKICRETVLNQKPVVCVLHQVPKNVVATVLEMFNTNHYPSFFTAQELSEWRGQMDLIALRQGLEPTQVFFDRIHENLRIVLCYNSVSMMHENLHDFQPFIRNSIFNQIEPWSHDSLADVARTRLPQMPEDRDMLGVVLAQMHRNMLQEFSEGSMFINYSAFLYFVQNFGLLLTKRRKTQKDTRERLTNGVLKLSEAETAMESLSKNLEKSRKSLQILQKECEDYLVSIVQQKRETDDQSKVVTVRSDRLRQEESEIQSLTTEAEMDLAHVLSAFDTAIHGLESISKKDLQEIKSYTKPPPIVEKVLEAVMILRKVVLLLLALFN
jgi:dynein heavy chain